MGRKYEQIEICESIELTEENIGEKLPRGQENLDKIREPVEEILHNVKYYGDAAIMDYTAKFDNLPLNELTVEVTPEEFDEALNQTSQELIDALQAARKNIEKFHRAATPTRLVY